MRAITILSVFLAMGMSAVACVNITQTRLDGAAVTTGYSTIRLLDLKKALATDLRPEGERMEASLRAATDINGRSDYAVALMYLGRAEEAVARLKALEQEHSGEYFVAANLGTAYELAGNNAEALRWIQEGIRRNPESHEGTEWLHVRILEAKIQEEKDPTYFEHHSVLDVDPTNPTNTVPEELQGSGNKMVLEWVKRALLHQLNERLQFVKPPDKPVAGLLFDLAMLEAGTHSLEPATKLLELAKDYGYSSAKADAVLADFRRKIFWREVHTTYPVIVASIVVFLVLGGLVFLARAAFSSKSISLKNTQVRSFRLSRPAPSDTGSE